MKYRSVEKIAYNVALNFFTTRLPENRQNVTGKIVQTTNR